MKVLPIIHTPNRILKLPSLPVVEITDEIRQLMLDMLTTCRHHDGAGLAAIQIGHLKRIIVIDLYPAPIFMVNPVIRLASAEKVVEREACLSIPNQYIEVKRHKSVVVKFKDFIGEDQELIAGGALGRAIQHEIDHLDGILITDKKHRKR